MPTNQIDPYSPIEKRSLWTSDSMRSAGYSVRVADPNAPSGWSECGIVSADYLVIPNADARDVALEIAERSGLGFTTEQTFFDGRRYALSLVATERGLVDTRVGDPVGIGLRVENSYDGSRRFSASLFVYRLVCKNGMLAPSLFRRITFKHVRSSEGWEDEVRRSLAMIAAAPAGLARFAEAAQTLAAMRVTAGRLQEIRRDVLPKLPVTLWGKTIDRFLAHESLDGFGVLNAATNVTWHDPSPSMATFAHNEYVTERLVAYALGTLEDRRN